MKYLGLLSIIVLLSIKTALAQNEPFYSYKREVGTNITRLLGNMLSLTPVTNSEPYALQFAYHSKKYTYRLGLNGNAVSSTDLDLTSGSAFVKTIQDEVLSSRFCLEKHLPLSPKFQLNYGLDLVAGRLNSISSTDNFFSRTLKTNSLGAGPSLRFAFKLSKRIHLQTETTLYGRFINKSERVETSGQAPKFSSSNDWDVKLQLPAQLFINIEF